MLNVSGHVEKDWKKTKMFVIGSHLENTFLRKMLKNFDPWRSFWKTILKKVKKICLHLVAILKNKLWDFFLKMLTYCGNL